MNVKKENQFYFLTETFYVYVCVFLKDFITHECKERKSILFSDRNTLYICLCIKIYITYMHSTFSATHWQDGSRITYIPRSHLSSGHNNSCCLAAVFSSGSVEEQWGFTRCSEKKPFICEYKAGRLSL